MGKHTIFNKIRQWAAVSLMVSMMVPPSILSQTAYGAQESYAARGSGTAAGQEQFTGLLSYVSFPCRFEDYLPESGGDRYYLFQIDSSCDLTISAEYDGSACRYGLELLNSSQERLGISERENSQRIMEPGAETGAYFLRVFSIGDSDRSEPYRISIAKTELSEDYAETVDFSELHMVASIQAPDSPYFLNGYDVNHYYDWYQGGFVQLDAPIYQARGVNAGGIYPMPQYYYRYWIGPVSESVFNMKEKVRDKRENESTEDYEQYLSTTGIRYYEGGNPLIHVQDSIALPQRFYDRKSGNEEERAGWMEHLKNAIMTYGAATTGIYWGDTNLCEEKQNYYCSGYEYRRKDEDSPWEVVDLFEDNEYASASNLFENHEVNIVGWDDNYPRENFRYRDWTATDSNLPSLADDEYLPDQDGAWIIRNSWGTNAGEDGYYYVSYADKRLVSADNSWVYCASEANDNYNKLYTTALAIAGTTVWHDSTAISNVFTADGEGMDIFRAVSFELSNYNAEYRIGINRGADIGGGVIEENIYASGFKKYAGIYTVRLNKPIFLEPGETFEVVLELTLDEDDDQRIAFPIMVNDYRQGNLPRRTDISYAYGPSGREDLCDPQAVIYGYATLEALCYDANLDDGDLKRVPVFELEPDKYYDLIASASDADDVETSMQLTKTETGSRMSRRFGSIRTDDSSSENNKYDDRIYDEDEIYDEEIWDEENLTASDSNASDSNAEESKKNLSDYGVFRGKNGEGRILRPLPKHGNGINGNPRDVEADLPDHFDLREEYALTPVKNQKQTNTCWAFGSTSSVESSYILNGNNLYNYNYASGVKLETKLPVMEDGRILYRFDKNNPDTMGRAVFDSRLLSWDGGPIENMGANLLWEFSGDLHAIDFTGSAFDGQSGAGKFSASGEETLIFTPKADGMITVRVSSADDPTKAAVCDIMLMEANRVNRVTVEPESLSLRVGAAVLLNVEIDAEPGAEVKLLFTSDNPQIASVDDRGKVIALHRGITKIRVRAGDKEAVCTVTVTGGGSSSSGSDRKKTIADHYPGAEVGDWTLNADGSWNFRAGGRDYKDAWGYLYNPYGNGGAGDAGWYRFDAAGKMITGWFTDLDGNVYYMNPIPDGNRGKMCTGWAKIREESGQENSYYFSEVSGGPLGALVKEKAAPDV